MIDWDNPESPETRAALAAAERLDAVYADVEAREADELARDEREALPCQECGRVFLHDEECPNFGMSQADEMAELRRAALDGRGRP